jgi:nucleotide-binding universal stress UspA family protein
MRWIVGLDLRPASHGATELAAWLKEHAQGHRMTGLHVIERKTLVNPTDDTTTQQIELAAETQANRTLEETKTRWAFDDIGVTFGATAEENLEAALLARHADGLIIGRAAPTGDDALVRLGRVARRLLRTLPAPTIVAPPELDKRDVPDGPIVALTDMRDDAVAAVRFAHALARAMKRELVVAHVVSWLEQVVVYLPRPSSDEADDTRKKAEGDLRSWLEKHALEADRTLVRSGQILRECLQLALDERACMLVCGSRNLSAAERLFIPSVGTELAAACSSPVAVVPDDFESAS